MIGTMKRYALVGTGGRALEMFVGPIATEMADVATLVGVCDPNPLRASVVAAKGGGVPVFAELDAMLRETKPDTVIVCTMDSMHHRYIVGALEAGCDVITEKPMTIDAPRCRAILEAERRTGRRVTVIFNFRYYSLSERIKAIVARGDIGAVLAADFEWILDTRHGADYFRRWHRRLENSGGLLVHKATHHFDIVNWWLADDPVSVYANGSRRFYGDDRRPHGERCLTCPHGAGCAFYWDIRSDSEAAELYLATESADGYWRDRCVFDNAIDIMDSMSLAVRYAGGALLTYSLVAHSPWEGWRISISGTGGRLEAEDFSSGSRAADRIREVRVWDRQGGETVHRVVRSDAVHGGSDALMRTALFRGGVPDPLGRQAGSRAGAMSLLIGAAANLSIASGQAVRIDDLLCAREGSGA